MNFLVKYCVDDLCFYRLINIQRSVRRRNANIMANTKNSKSYNQASKNYSSGRNAKPQKRSTANSKIQPKNSRQAAKAKAEAEYAKKQESRAQATIVIVIACVVALLLELCNFNVLGRLGGYLKYGMFGLFGVMAYIFPIAIIALAFYIKLGKGVQARKPVCGVVIFACLCAIMHTALASSPNDDSLLQAFTESAENASGGGIVGGVLGIALAYLVGTAGTYIICILAILVCLVIITEIPIIEFITGKSKEEKYYIEDEPETYERPRNIRQPRSNAERLENIYEGTDKEGNYVKIVHVPSDRKTRRYNKAALKRSQKKSETMRRNSPNMSRFGNKPKGIGKDLDIVPCEGIKDEFREITRADLRPLEEKKETIVPEKPHEQVKVTDIPVKKETLFAQDLEKEEALSVKTGTAAGRSSQNYDNETRNAKKANAKSNVVEAVHAGAGSTYAKQTLHGRNEDGYQYPPLDLLEKKKVSKASEENTDNVAHNIEVILATYGVSAKVINKEVGPSVTRYELQPELGTRVNKITSLADDLKLNLAVPDMRIEAPIPGRAAIGLEIPNKTKQAVSMRQLLEDTQLIRHPSKIAYAAGVDISGKVVVSDIAKMPHMLVAGTTGSGKSTFLNTILMAILYRAKPEEVGLIIIDPKKIEFGGYSGLPHLVQEVVTDAGQAVSVLRWAVAEMGKRYDRMKLAGAKDFASYNEKFDRGEIPEEEIAPKRMAQIVIVIDELADLMMVASKEVESLIVRLAQLARAAGIHLIIAMQRPSVDVVTGLIKANIPARVALKVASGVDSRTIIDSFGAEKLLGYGDMLFMPTGFNKAIRLQGAFVSEKEVADTIEFIKTHNSSDYYAKEAEDLKQEFERAATGITSSGFSSDDEGGAEKYDEFFYEAGKLCIETGKASSSMLQRRFSIGFNRAARIIEQLEEMGAVGPANGAKPREILVDEAGFDDLYNSMK